VLAGDLDTAIRVTDKLAPEHLELQVADADAVWKRLNSYGGLFIGANTAEVFGDYGAGPNHVLPTSGTARYTGGLSVFTFLVSHRLPGCMRASCVVALLLPAAPVAFSYLPRRDDFFFLASRWPRLIHGLCVQRIRTWLRSDAAPEDKAGLRALVDDSAALARLEGLYGHEAAALARRKAAE
jgi:histidinol dehydrogenase